MAHPSRTTVLAALRTAPWLLLATLGGSALAQAQTLKPGLWEMQSSMKSDDPRMNEAMAQAQAQLAALPPEQRRMMESMMAQRGVHMGSMGAGGATVRVCLSKEMVERNEVAAMAQGDCQTQLQPRSGNTMRFSFSCKQPPSSGEGVVTFLGPDSYHSKVNVRDGARGQSMQVEAQAKFIAADCGNLRPLGGR